MLIQDVQTLFDQILIDILKGRYNKAIIPLEQIIETALQPPNFNIQHYIFANALLKRIGHDYTPKTVHPLLKEYQHMDLVTLKKAWSLFPVDPVFIDAFNRTLISACSSLKKLVYFDIGLVRFEGIHDFLTRIRTQAPHLESITIVTFLSTRQDSQAVIEAELQAFVPDIPLKYVPQAKPLAILSPKDWEKLRDDFGQGILIGGSVALMNIFYHSDLPHYSRETILKELKAFKPVLLLLFEENVNYAEISFIRRFYIAWQHIERVYAFINSFKLDNLTTVSIKMIHQNAINYTLQERKIDDNIIHVDLTNNWVNLLSMLGFSFYDIPIDTLGIPNYPESGQFQHHGTHVGMDYEGYTIASLIGVKCDT